VASVSEREKLLEDALDHIKRIAGMARVPTKRLDWIVARASMALLGEPWDNSYVPTPKNAEATRAKVKQLEKRINSLSKELEVSSPQPSQSTESNK
jgi:predicted GTPase